MLAVGILFLLSPILSTGQLTTPIISSFALFTSDGAVGNTGTSQVTGNVGTNNGAITGFGNVNGVMHNANTTTAAAKNELLIAYNLLKGTPSTFTIAPVFGNGDTLEAGVYDIAGVATLNGVLYLDAQGNSNARFLFKMGAAFSSNPNAKVKLINGALACNIAWITEGAVTLGTSTFFKGNIIANNAAVNLTTNDTLEGRALSTTGAINISNSLVYTPTGCGSPMNVGPVAPTLGSAECYALFSRSGNVTNTGITYVTGDVGTNVTTTAGFDAQYVTGTIHPIPNVSTAMAAPEVLNAYNYMNTLPHDIQLLFPAQFGNNLVLTPHTYLLDAATSLTGNLFLNAEGNSNAVFVIKISGALSTSTFSKVILLNGAKSNNVYWKVTGAVNINDYSVFHGTSINDGALNLATGDSIYGRAFTILGALNSTAIIAISPKVTCVPLPVSWLYFRGKQVKTNALLEWATSAEINNKYFTIEKSKDGVMFENIATVNTTTGNAKRDYSFLDVNPYALGYYRISQTDFDGRRSYYKTIQLDVTEFNVVNVNPTIQGNNILIQISGATAGRGALVMYNTDGTKVATQQIELTNETNTYRIQKPFKKGVYIITILNNGERISSTKLMVQ